MTIALGDPTRIPESGTLAHPLDSSFTLSACTVDPKLDVVIPAYWSAKATTVGFDTLISMRALFADGGSGTPGGIYTGHGVAPTSGDDRVLVEQKFSNGPSCEAFSSTNSWGYGESDGFGVQWDDPAPPGSVRTSYFFIVIKGYYSPATPQGDPALLDWIVLKPLFGGDQSQAAMVYRDTAGMELDVYSQKGITLSGKVTSGQVAPTVVPPTIVPPATVPTASARCTPPSAAPEGQKPPATQSASTPGGSGSFAVGDQVTIKVDGVVMRATPSQSGEGALGPLLFGESLTVVGGPAQGDGHTWYQVETSYCAKGWVMADDITMTFYQPAQ